MMHRILAAAIAAGLFAAALISVVEVFTTTPLILEAERYEAAEQSNVRPDKIGHSHDGQGWPSEEGLKRFLNTVIVNVALGVSFALLVIVGLTFGDKKTDVAKGLLLAFGGFTAFTLSPAFGLPPELPGMPTPDLQFRQHWWLCTVILSIGGLACLFATRTRLYKVLGVVLLIAPHVWGAPHAATHDSLVPATLAAEFAAATIVVNALFWVLIGTFSPMFFNQFMDNQPRPQNRRES